jgi:hypothetical protein
VVECNGFDGFGAMMSKALEFVAPALFPLVPVRAFDEVAVFECGTGVLSWDFRGFWLWQFLP